MVDDRGCSPLNYVRNRGGTPDTFAAKLPGRSANGIGARGTEGTSCLFGTFSTLAPGTSDVYASMASSSGDWLKVTALSCDQTVVQVNLSLLEARLYFSKQGGEEGSESVLSMVLPGVSGMLGKTFPLPPSTELVE